MAKTGCAEHANLKTSEPVCMVCMMQHRDALHDALKELLGCFDAGFSIEMLNDDKAFSDFLAANQARTEKACLAARQLLIP